MSLKGERTEADCHRCCSTSTIIGQLDSSFHFQLGLVLLTQAKKAPSVCCRRPSCAGVNLCCGYMQCYMQPECQRDFSTSIFRSSIHGNALLISNGALLPSSPCLSLSARCLLIRVRSRSHPAIPRPLNVEPASSRPLGTMFKESSSSFPTLMSHGTLRVGASF